MLFDQWGLTTEQKRYASSSNVEKRVLTLVLFPYDSALGLIFCTLASGYDKQQCYVYDLIFDSILNKNNNNDDVDDNDDDNNDSDNHYDDNDIHAVYVICEDFCLGFQHQQP